MIGNDVVDLSLAKKESNWKRKGYLEKIFTTSEIDFINKNSNPDNIVWSLWSRKEAVYKILIQKGINEGYFPIKIECQDFKTENGIVKFKNQIYYTKTTIKNDLIHSIAVENIRDFEKIINVTNLNDLVKNNEIPFYKLGTEFLAASKSHHGKFLEAVYLK